MPEADAAGARTRWMARWAIPAMVLVACVLSISPPGRAQGTYTLQAIHEAASTTEALRGLLEESGTRLVGPDGKTVCEIWWARSIKLRAVAGKSSPTGYGAIEDGTLLGILRFATENEDSRDQKLKAGWYTMRYATMPSDEAHKGASAYRDFGLLIPAAFDGTPSEIPKPEMLLRLSRKASLTPHPAVISLIPINPAYRTFPAAVADDAGNCAVQARLHGNAAGRATESDLDISILLVTPPKEGDAS